MSHPAAMHDRCACSKVLEKALREIRNVPHEYHAVYAIATAALDFLDKSSCHPLDTPHHARQRGEREAVAGKINFMKRTLQTDIVVPSRKS